MKTLKIFVLALLLATVPATAFAATLSHSPDYTYVAVPAGSSATVPVTVFITDARVTYYLWFVDSVKGNLPAGWITPTRKTAFLNRYWNSASTELKISVPKDAEPGKYAGYLYSKAMASHEFADPGQGMLIEVLVPSNCAGVPVVEITGFGPDVIWPPNHSMKVVTVSGTVKMPAGCTLYEAGYSIEDEYGEYTSVGEFTVDHAGEFTVALPVEAWREGQDKDGRHYRITLFAEDDAGMGSSQVLEAVVPHDKGNR